MKKFCVVLLMSLVVVSCGSKRKIVTKKKDSRPKIEQVSTPTETPTETIGLPPKTSSPQMNSTEAYIAYYSAIAQEEMRKYKIPASITLAQGILESGSGKGRLAVEANNHFGIKCHGWTGEKIYHDDDASQECFRKYTYAKSSFEDHSLFLTSRSRYSKLFQLREDDYKSWAKGLRAAGYATDRRYPEKLISLIERYKLYRYDDEVLGNYTPKNVSTSETALTHIVVKGDTLYSLSRKYNLTVEQLKSLNNLKTNDLSIGQVLKLN
ncbi:glucosaminidase domain-containing protein [Psychroserpens sp. XS_ASV72]|uniref:glucosaminidase domain-containing protein n=1 Tax=Psychroserpens sp. XS_ASV72 TaxID=3241293 RepID=UPI003515D409